MSEGYNIPTDNYTLSTNTSSNTDITFTGTFEQTTSNECPECGNEIERKRDHADGCPNWGMLPKHWRGD